MLTGKEGVALRVFTLTDAMRHTDAWPGFLDAIAGPQLAIPSVEAIAGQLVDDLSEIHGLTPEMVEAALRRVFAALGEGGDAS